MKWPWKKNQELSAPPFQQRVLNKLEALRVQLDQRVPPGQFALLGQKIDGLTEAIRENERINVETYRSCLRIEKHFATLARAAEPPKELKDYSLAELWRETTQRMEETP